MDKIAIIINPVSGKGNGAQFYEKIKDAPIIKNAFATFFLTKKPLDATEIVKDISTKFDRIIICGGDGTLHEAINGFDIDSNAILGLVPIGSGNDFSLSLHKKKNAPILLLEYYLSQNPSAQPVDFGEIRITDSHGREFRKRMINSFGVGFDAKVAFYNQINKTFSGTLSYIYAILKALFEFSQIEIEAKFNGKIVEDNVLFCAVGNGKSIGGGLYLMPNAIVDDGLLDLSIIRLKSRIKFLFLLPKVISNNIGGRKELLEESFKELQLTLKKPFYAHIDGEIITDVAKEIVIKLSDKRINFMYNRL